MKEAVEPAVARSGNWRRLLATAVVAALVLTHQGNLSAQAGVVLRGTVTRDDGEPVAAAQVRVSGEAAGGAEMRTRTGADGRYELRLPLAATRYAVVVAAPGLSAATRLAAPAAGSSLVILDFELTPRTVLLDPIRVRPPRVSVAAATASSPGTVKKSRHGAELRRDPIEVNPLADLASQQTGVAAMPDGAGVSMAGQSPDQTRLTMDGATAEGVVVPREAIRSVSVMASPFDVSRGQLTGGQIDVQTQDAGNEWGGTARLDVAGARLQYGGGAAGIAAGRSRYAVDAGGGGALVRNRLFAFGAFTGSRTSAPPFDIATMDTGALRRLAVNPDSASRFLRLADVLGVARARAPDHVASVASGLLRLHGPLARGQTGMLRVNAQRTALPLPLAPTSVSATSSQERTLLGVLGQVASNGERAANDLQLYASSSRSDLAADPLPSGSVAVASDGSPAAGGSSPFWFGGSPFRGRNVRQESLELRDQLVLVTRNRRHRLRLGGEAILERFRLEENPGGGNFVFHGLESLQTNRPVLFSRKLGYDSAAATARRIALYVDDRWNSDRVQISYGLRAEQSAFGRGTGTTENLPALSGSVAEGVRPRWEISPRVGFSARVKMPWDRTPGATTGFYGGAGRFVGTLRLADLATAFAEDGTARSATLVCTGAAVPMPAWQSYRNDPGTAPAACADGGSGSATALPRASVFDEGFTAPRVWRASLGTGGVGPLGVFWEASAAAVQGVSQPLGFDGNLRGRPAFANEHEGGRLVYASPLEIDPATGIVPASASRESPELGVVRVLTSRGRSRTVQLSASLARVQGGSNTRLGYTYTSAVETAGPLAALAGTQGSAGADPEQWGWSRSPYTPRHMLFLASDWRRSRILSVGVLARMSSGTPYTPGVRGDANGDGADNDRAFVFRPGPATDASAGMAKLLDAAPARVRDCLLDQAGRIAARNSCAGPASLSLDVRARLQVGPRLPGSPYRRGTLWIVARNLTAGLDNLVNGPDRLRNWGQSLAVDDALLRVRGFDPQARQFRYDVNGQFGRAVAGSFAQRVPFSISVQARIAIGSDRVDAAFQRTMEAASDRVETRRPENLAAHLEQQLPNLAAAALELNGPKQLRLTPDQVERLQPIADSARHSFRRLVGSLVQVVLAGGAGTLGWEQPGADALVAEALVRRRAQADLVQSILTPQQWRKLGPLGWVRSSRFLLEPPERFAAPPEY